MNRSGRGERGTALEPESRAYLVGLARRGMSGLAQPLVGRGVSVSGSEHRGSHAVDRLRRLGVRVHSRQAPSPSIRTARLLVHGPRIARNHPERLAVARRGLAQATPREVLALLTGGGIGVAVAGRRGAWSSAAMIGWILTHAGLDPTVVLRSPAPQLGDWARPREGPHVVVETSEMIDGLGPPAPRVAVILDVEDAPRTRHDQAHAAFGRLAATVPAAGSILAWHPDASVSNASRGVRSLVDAGTRARWAASLEDAISDLDRHLEPGDVLVTLGSGDVGTISDAFLRRLPRHRHGR